MKIVWVDHFVSFIEFDSQRVILGERLLIKNHHDSMVGLD